MWRSFKVPRLLEYIFAHARFLENEHYHVVIIINPYAGAFRRPDLLIQLQRHFQAFLEKIDRLPYHPEKVQLLETERAGQEYELVDRIVHSRDPRKTCLVAIAGGDGTANHVLSAFLLTEPRLRQNMLFFRLPLGTGNDFADAKDLGQLFQVLQGDYEPIYLPYFEYRANGVSHGFGFNIGSIGLDAWVVKTNERLRKALPGNFYKIAADLAGLFYHMSAKPGNLRAEYFYQGKSAGVSDGPFLLTAFAPTGYRTYGGGIKVLPGEENLCRIDPVSMLTFFALKGNFFKGLHVREPYTTMVKFDRVIFQAEKRLVAQHDGEIFWLEPEMCPYEVRVLPGELAFLRPRAEARSSPG